MLSQFDQLRESGTFGSKELPRRSHALHLLGEALPEHFVIDRGYGTDEAIYFVCSCGEAWPVEWNPLRDGTRTLLPASCPRQEMEAATLRMERVTRDSLRALGFVK